MPGRHRGQRSPFYIRPGTKQYVYPKAERFKIVKAHLQRDIMKGRKPTTMEAVTLAHAAALLVDIHQNLKAFEEGKALPKDHLQKMQHLRASLTDLKPKAPAKSGNAAKDEPIGLADILNGGDR